MQRVSYVDLPTMEYSEVEFELMFADLDSAIEHKNQNGNGNIFEDDKKGHYRWVGSYSEDYIKSITEFFFMIGKEMPGFSDIGIHNTLCGELMIIDRKKVFTKPAYFLNGKDIFTVHRKLHAANVNIKESKFIGEIEWKIPTLDDLCYAYSKGVITSGCYWFSDGIDNDALLKKSHFNYCGRYVNFNTKKSSYVTYREMRDDNACDAYFSPSDRDSGYSESPLLIVIRNKDFFSEDNIDFDDGLPF